MTFVLDMTKVASGFNSSGFSNRKVAPFADVSECGHYGPSVRIGRFRSDAARIGASPAIDAIEFAATWRKAEGSDPPFLAAAVGRLLVQPQAQIAGFGSPGRIGLVFGSSDGTETSRNSGCRYGGLQSANGGRRIRHARTPSDPSHRTRRSRHREEQGPDHQDHRRRHAR